MAWGSQGRGSRANAANYDGSVVVGYSKQPDWGGPQPTVWEDGTMAVLSAWDRGGELRSVNSDGSILTGYVYDPDTGFSPATLWKKEDSIWRTISLGVLPGTQPVYGTGISLAVTDDGNTVVGTNRFSMTNYGGFVWTASEGMMSPADFFAANQVSVSEDFVVISFSDISPDGNIIVGYGFDSSVWNAPITSFVVHLNQVTAVPNALVQGTLNLGPACPNPFNPSTSFDLTIEQSGSMRVEIFDARGRLVRILHDGILAEGSHSLTWNGRTSTGRLAGSGVYLARASNALGEAVTRRMTLVK